MVKFNIEGQHLMDSTKQNDQTEQAKKEWSWQKRETRLNLYILETLQWGITTLQRHENLLKHATPATSQKEKCQQLGGLIKSIGLDLRDLKSRLQRVRSTERAR